MHYGSLQGEVGAAGHVGGSTGAGGPIASLIGDQFNVAGASMSSVGVYVLRLNDPIGAAHAAVVACGTDLLPSVASVVSHTDKLTTIATTNLIGGAPVIAPFYFIILRTKS